MVIADGSTRPPAPAPTPTGDLEPVGLIPLPSIGTNARERERYQAKVRTFPVDVC